MNKRRLLKLADILDKVPRKHFDLGCFTNSLPENIHTCGTTACALGYAAVDPGFRRAGLKFTSNIGLDIQYRKWSGTYAAMSFFELDEATILSLFYPNEAREYYNRPWDKITPKMVSRAIRNLVKEGSL